MKFYCSEKHDKTNWFHSDWDTIQNMTKVMLIMRKLHG
jgi:hypothetical protein